MIVCSEARVKLVFMALFFGIFQLLGFIGYPVLQVYVVLSNRGVRRYVAMAIAVFVVPVYCHLLWRFTHPSGNSKADAFEIAIPLFGIGFLVMPLLFVVAVGGRAPRSR